MDGWTAGRPAGRPGRLGRLWTARTAGWTAGRLDGWTAGRLDGWTAGRLDKTAVMTSYNFLTQLPNWTWLPDPTSKLDMAGTDPAVSLASSDDAAMTQQQ